MHLLSDLPKYINEPIQSANQLLQKSDQFSPTKSPKILCIHLMKFLYFGICYQQIAPFLSGNLDPLKKNLSDLKTYLYYFSQ